MPASKGLTEILPATQDTVSALGSAHAPFIYFDGVLARGINSGGVAQLTLGAGRLGMDMTSNMATRDHVVVAHVRCSIDALKDLQRNIAFILSAAAEPEGAKH